MPTFLPVRRGLIAALVSLSGGVVAQSGALDTVLLPALLRGKSAKLDTVLRNPAYYEVQILYTQVDRDARNRPTFRSYGYRLDRNAYFYPASTVKLPTALLALEKINRLKIKGLDKHTTMLTDSACCGQTAVRHDSTAASRLPSVGQYVKKILVVSDNDAHNRLYEWVGQDALNDQLHAKGYPDVRVVSRLAVGATREQNRATNPVRFVANGKTIHAQPLAVSQRDYRSPFPIAKGRGEMQEGRLVEGPKGFTYNNNFPLADQQRMLQNVLFPESFPPTQRFVLTPDDYQWLYQYLSQLPRETRFPRYDAPEDVDGYVKFVGYGDTKDTIPANIRIFNKVGEAYGTLTDNAYVVDFDQGVEFFLSATVYVNADGVFNDNHYEYDTIGFPFLGELGRQVYRYELTRTKARKPDLSRFRLRYDDAKAIR